MRTDVFLRILLVATAVMTAFVESAHARETGGIGEPDPGRECTASFRTIPSFVWRGSTGGGYSAEAPSMWEEGVVRVDVSEGDCPFALVVDPGDATLRGRDGSVSMILSDAPGGRDLVRSSLDPASSPFRGLGGSGEIHEFGVYLTLPRGQVVHAGDYSANVPVRLYLLDSGLPVQVDETMIDVSASVGARFAVEGSGFVAGVADLDLGDLSSGFHRRIDLAVVGNAPVSMTVDSANGGRLRHDRADIWMPYRLSMDGRPMDLSAGGARAIFDLDPVRTRMIGLEIEGDAPSRAVAGTYADTLTLVFRSEM